jgi:hypothetical protein
MHIKFALITQPSLDKEAHLRFQPFLDLDPDFFSSIAITIFAKISSPLLWLWILLVSNCFGEVVIAPSAHLDFCSSWASSSK